MSRVGGSPINIPDGVTIDLADGIISVSYTHLTLPTMDSV